MIKLKEINALDLVRIQGDFFRKIKKIYSDNQIDLAELYLNDYSYALILIVKDKFDFSDCDVKSFEEAINDLELVKEMLVAVDPLMADLGELSKKKL